jgi:hydrophobe/amphiphile efflux-1 (HAE1) family protein
MLIVLTLGITLYSKMNVRMMPDVEFPYVLVMTTYEGAGANEIEQQVTRPVEDAMSGISGIKHITSISQDNISIVFMEFELTKPVEEAAQDVRDKIATTVRALPDEIETPVVMKLDMDAMPLVGFSLKAEMSDVELYDFAANTLSNELAQVSGVSQVNIVGGVKREIHVNADKRKLKDYQLTLSAIAQKIRSNSLNVPSGKIDRGASEMSYRTIGEFQSIDEINDVIVNFIGNDIPVKVKDIAVVEDSTQERASIGRVTERVDGEIVSENSLMVIAFKQAKTNDIKISDGLIKKMGQLNEKYKNVKGSPQLALTFDNAEAVRKNVDDVMRTIYEGIFLAVLVVYLFLGNWRSTFITALALPNSLIGAFLFMSLAGFSINILTLMSLSLAVGLLIDDAIVVRENIFRHYEQGKNPLEASVDGVHEVTLAVIATTAAVIAVFAPMGFVGGLVGRYFREFSMTIVFVMAISTIDALTIAPMLSAYIIPTHEKVAEIAARRGFFVNISRRIVSVFRFLTVVWFNKLFDIVQRVYDKVITRISRSHKWSIAIIAGSILFLVGSIGVASKFLKFSFMPNFESGQFSLNVTAKPGTSIEKMLEYNEAIEEIAMSYPDIKSLVSSIGGGSGFFGGGANETSITVSLVESKERKNTASQIRESIRKDLNEKFKDEDIDFTLMAQAGMGAESDLNMEIRGANGNMEILYEVSRKLISRYKDIPHLVDLHSNFQLGKPEIQIRVDKAKTERMGVNSVEAGSEIRAMIDGTVAGKYRTFGNEYDIKVQLPKYQKDIAKDAANTYVFNVNGRLVRLDNVANLVEAGGPTAIYRKDKSRYITVEGNLEEGGFLSGVQAEAIKIFNEEKAKPENAHWGDVYLAFGGDAETMVDMQKSMMMAAGMGLLFIFLVLASLYESIITPFTIMSALPLAIIGGIVALIISNQPLDMFTIIGMIMLLGIVAKNSILLIDYTQQQIRAGLKIEDALIKAGETRLRPILMTSMALIAGMLPTALGLTEAGRARQGMGIVVIGGIISSTFLTLLVVPAIFEYMDQFRRFLRRIVQRPNKRMVDYTEEELKKMKL